MTAQQLAAELEVSVRTIYRDIDALSVAGVPVYAERGPGGGCDLLDSYRTDLTGMTDDELSALFMLSVPAPLTDLGVSAELKGALHKLSAALMTNRRPADTKSRDRVHLDSTWWFQEKEPIPHLRTIQQAVWQNRKLQITLLFRQVHEIRLDRVVAPYGLVAKTSVWYLVWADEDVIRANRVSSIVDAQITDERFEYPADFDLASFWQAWCAEFEASRPSYPVTLRVDPELMPLLQRSFGASIQKGVEHVAGDEWVRVRLEFEHFFEARSRILSYGGAVEVLEPRPLRLSVADFAQQIAARYG
jgi:predicted DNA-binding transcriptional regulator YafY